MARLEARIVPLGWASSDRANPPRFQEHTGKAQNAENSGVIPLATMCPCTEAPPTGAAIARLARWLLGLIVVISTLLAPLSATADEPCAPQGSHRDFAHRDVTVFHLTDANETHYGCLLSTNRPVALRPVDASYGTGHEDYAASGSVLAYALGADGDFNDRYNVGSVDLATGRFGGLKTFSVDDGLIGGLVVKSNSAWAIIMHERGKDSAPSTVYVYDRRGFRVPAHGRNAIDGSLRLRGSRLSWKQYSRRHNRRYSTPLG